MTPRGALGSQRPARFRPVLPSGQPEKVPVFAGFQAPSVTL